MFPSWGGWYSDASTEIQDIPSEESNGSKPSEMEELKSQLGI